MQSKNPFESSAPWSRKSYSSFVRNQIENMSVGESKKIEMNDGGKTCSEMSRLYYPISGERGESGNKLVRKCRSAIRSVEFILGLKFKTKIDEDGAMWVLRVL